MKMNFSLNVILRNLSYDSGFFGGAILACVFRLSRHHQKDSSARKKNTIHRRLSNATSSSSLSMINREKLPKEISSIVVRYISLLSLLGIFYHWSVVFFFLWQGGASLFVLGTRIVSSPKKEAKEKCVVNGKTFSYGHIQRAKMMEEFERRFEWANKLWGGR